MKLKGAIFDFDGTLADTIPICIAAFREAFAKVSGPQLADAQIAALFGPTEEGIIRRLVPNRWKSCLRLFLEAYDRLHENCAAPFPGVETALGLLQQRGVRLAIVTGKGKPTAAISFRHLGLTHYFDVIQTGSRDGNVKSALIRKVIVRWRAASQEVAYVGDSPADMRAAKEVGVLALAAAWAPSANYGRLSEQAPAKIFRSVDSFLAWIEKNIETAGTARGRRRCISAGRLGDS